MKKYIYIALGIIFLWGIICLQQVKIKRLTIDRDAYKTNSTTLLEGINTYITKDSLNAVSVGNLELKLSEMKKYREDDMKLIETLNVDKKRLQQITTAQIRTSYDLSGLVRDSIVYRDSLVRDTLRCISIRDKWFDMNGCIDSMNFTGRFENRDSLMYVEHIIPKKFLFIKWGCKERRQEIVSRNPHTLIVGAEFISVRK